MPLNQWLALTSVEYHDNLLVLMLLNQWLALTSVKYHGNPLVLILLNQWFALTSVKYHDNLLVLMPLNQWLALTSVKYHDNLLVLMPLSQWLALTTLQLCMFQQGYPAGAHHSHLFSLADAVLRNGASITRVQFLFRWLNKLRSKPAAPRWSPGGNSILPSSTCSWAN